ncbi:MAG: cytochrome c oxidase assembly factor 1 family protein [Prosthecobacter sp.]|jgi:hypothetical protein|uniref:cytochrome c oxidase assembly factor Coa1 family protein n=1 Tax=Prosthecobacter sp. TaxID=1965333 RepID=UPI0019EA57EE|nr:cytochrome c oxidase assembly factor Coa1 family protein [Prosthecobacter sp.]MBE2285230.1 cytochrome c oxidase assembly factor 1 family protein [Prosthecobacter sp.]
MNAESPFPNAPPPLPPKKTGAAKWVLVGCGGCLGLIVLGAVLSAVIFFFATGIIRETDVYSHAFKRVQESAEVKEALGTPIKAGWTFSGSVNYNNGAGSADFTLPVTGPKGEGTLNVKANKASGSPWKYEVLEVQLPGDRKVDLREP